VSGGIVELSDLIPALSDPAAYPLRVERVDVRQTHISVVFLAGDFVYKIKKPVRLGFLDFSTLALRKHFCEEEVRLNARLAREVYLGVVPIAEHGGRLCFEADGQPLEWAVKMRRLADDATLEAYLQRGDVSAKRIQTLAEKLAAFHAAAERGEQIAQYGRFDVVAANARGNFEQSRGQIGETINAAVYERLRQATELALEQFRPVIAARAARGVPCDTHGDLRVDHIYFLGEPNSEAEHTVVIDCIEFNEAYRYADPIADMAFLTMDLKFAGERRLAETFAAAYLHAAGDSEGRCLVPFYSAYRAAVRGKVEGLKQAEPEVPEADREAARMRARGYWLLALGELEPPERRPGVVLVAGLPGSGKSTLAAGLAEQAGFEVIRSDVVRKELAGAASSQGSQPFGAGLYTAEWNERTYQECLRRLEACLFAGKRVIVDASFRSDVERQNFFAAARRWRVPVVLLHCEADPETVRRRLAQRRGDVSDADWSVYEAAAQLWEPPSEDLQTQIALIDSSGTPQQALAATQRELQALGITR
jgi:aminoglycoside phosphotransferase family enzyme/predicted kinase